MALQGVLLVGLLPVLLGSVCFASIVRYDGHQVVKVNPSTVKHLKVLGDLRWRHQVDLWNEPRMLEEPVLLRVAPHQRDFILRNLTGENLHFNITIPDLQRHFDEEAAYLASPPLFQQHKDIDVTRIQSLEEIYNYLDRVLTTYKYLASPISIGTTYEKRDIRGLKLTSKSGGSDKPVILLEFGVHAREWTSHASGVYIIYSLTNGYHSDPSIKALLEKYEFVIIPVSNPDGYEYTKKERLWRKNRAPNQMHGCVGTDINRNFDVQFSDGPPEIRHPCSEVYCGDYAFSEKESQALRDLFASLGSRLKVYFAVHAFSQLWMVPYGYTKSPPPNYSELMRISQIGVDAIKKSHGIQFRAGSISNIIYEASGSTLDWAYIKSSAKLSFALELRDRGTYGFALPRNQILPACEETWAGIKAAIEAV